MLTLELQDPAVSGYTLQQQLHQGLIDAILGGTLPLHDPLPSTRDLAASLGISRNTVVLTYQRLMDDGYLTPVRRRGHFVNEQYIRQQLRLRLDTRTASLFAPERDPGLWDKRLRQRPTRQRNIIKPSNWREFPYPFIYGQVATDKISIARWRDCMRLAGSGVHATSWIGDQMDADDPMLLDQIITRVLPHRGLRAHRDQLLVTMGAQNALYMIGQLLGGPDRRIGVENPGYVDANNIFAATGAELVPLPVDANGLMLSDTLGGCDVIYTTPSHQCPTSVTLSLPRRMRLVEQVQQDDLILIEDDYEHELNFLGQQHAAIKSYDNAGRVIYVGSLTKLVFPGVRIGFVLADAELIQELRALRRLVYRHPSAQNQRAMAIFIAEGHLDAHIRRTRDRLSAKWHILQREIARQMPDVHVTATTGGSALWLRLPDGLDTWAVHRECARRGVLIEPGDVHYFGPDAPRNRMRLGFAAVGEDRIAAGIALLAEAVEAVRQSAAPAG